MPLPCVLGGGLRPAGGIHDSDDNRAPHDGGDGAQFGGGGDGTGEEGLRAEDTRHVAEDDEGVLAEDHVRTEDADVRTEEDGLDDVEGAENDDGQGEQANQDDAVDEVGEDEHENDDEARQGGYEGCED